MFYHLPSKDELQEQDCQTLRYLEANLLQKIDFEKRENYKGTRNPDVRALCKVWVNVQEVLSEKTY
jgi:hypothetical protein